MKYFVKGRLISESNWIELINYQENNYSNLITDKNKAIKLLKESFIESIKSRSKPEEGVLLSGGIDSSIIAFMLNKIKPPLCYSVGLEGSEDLAYSKKLAKLIKLPLKAKTIDQSKFEKTLRKVSSLLKTDDIVKLEVGSVAYSALSLAKQDNIKTVFSGLGSEEIFCGYQRHTNVLESGYKSLHKECWDGLKGMWEKDLVRDTTLSSHFNINIETPFLDKNVISAAMKIHPRLKINANYKKIILRDLSLELGLSKEFCWRKKKAAQYGSKFDKALIKLAKDNGYKYKKDFVKSLL